MMQALSGAPAKGGRQMRSFDPSRDTDLYVEGYCKSFEDSYPGVAITPALSASFRESLANFDITPGLTTFTVESEQGEPAGFVVLGISEMDAVRQVTVEVIYVGAAHRRMGLARQLLARAVRHASDVGANSVRLDVSVVNQAAISLYESEGYVVTRYQMERRSAD